MTLRSASLSRRPWHGQRAEKLAPELKAGSGGPQPVTHGHLHPVFRSQAGQFVTAGHLQRKGLHVLAGVGQNLALARGSGRSVNAHHLAFRHAEQRQGVAVAQIRHVGEGQTPHVVETGDIRPGRDADSREPRPVDGIAHGLVHGPAHPGKLARGKGFFGQMGQKAGG